ncbi:geranylgeranyl pyrophosphate synthetase [Lasiosphaeria hispida]|uniref:Geranylgeranyl pyrophosphate synthetase n=1 Tax=Lasiosphaeria hispida TaxID=260671 RepID=A0AAJ0H583_9PEZI|nr:geranylgeranyl pyrophosphate synthetase [Lasiosphaeria hispida]
MPSCQCGRFFQTGAALIQHQAAKHSLQPQQARPKPTSSPQRAPAPSAPTRNTRPRDARIWKGVRVLEPIHTIDAAMLQPSTAPVSSALPSELICSFNWQSFGGFHVPGHAPLWQDVALPITIPRDRSTPSTGGSGWTTTKNPFEQVLQAAAVMSPDFRLDKVDIVTTRNSLRKLLDFCDGRSQQSFRVNISLVKNTLFIEQYGTAFMAFQSTGWGHNFEKTFTRFPVGLEASTTHDRYLHYPIGDLNCVVGFEVDACYEGSLGNDDEPAEATEGPLERVQAGMEQLRVSSKTEAGPSESKAKSTIASPTTSRARSDTSPPKLPFNTTPKIMPQSTAAEIKSRSKKPGGTIAPYLPQLWFGRTPWLIVGSHTEGTFYHVSVTNVTAHLERWEAERQAGLRKLAALLAELREAVREAVRGGGDGDGNGKEKEGQRCAVIYESGTERVIKVHVLGKGEVVVPDKGYLQFWGDHKI